MSDLAASISGFVAGNDLEVRRTITLPPAAITDAWLTLKLHENQADDATGVVQKHITTSEVVGTGHIENAGSPSVNGILRFDFTAAHTLAMGTHTYVYDVKVLLTGGKLYTPEKGTFELTSQVTQATS